jgi:hypothetical protein
MKLRLNAHRRPPSNETVILNSESYTLVTLESNRESDWYNRGLGVVALVTL